jgi:hypothetical protein
MLDTYLSIHPSIDCLTRPTQSLPLAPSFSLSLSLSLALSLSHTHSLFLYLSMYHSIYLYIYLAWSGQWQPTPACTGGAVAHSIYHNAGDAPGHRPLADSGSVVMAQSTIKHRMLTQVKQKDVTLKQVAPPREGCPCIL